MVAHRRSPSTTTHHDGSPLLGLAITSPELLTHHPRNPPAALITNQTCHKFKSNHRSNCLITKPHSIQHPKMNALFATLLAIVAMTVPSTSALLFSPLLLKANPWGVTERTADARTKTVKMPPQISRTEGLSSTLGADYSQDDDILRFKHELLGSVYERSLNRGFDDTQDQ